MAADKREPFFSSGTLVTIRSLQATNPNIPIVVAYSDLDDSQIKQLAGCETIKVASNAFNADHRPDMGTTTFLRFYATDLSYSRVVYIDSDMIITDKLDHIFLNPCPLMARAVDLPLNKDFRDAKLATKKYPLREGYPVINAGIMAYSTPYWRKRNPLEACTALASGSGWDFFLNPDQAMWLVIAYLNGGFGRLDHKDNFMTWSDMRPAEGKTITSSTGHLTALGTSGPARVLHWVGGVKPWHFDKHYFSPEKRAALFEDCYLQFVDSP